MNTPIDNIVNPCQYTPVYIIENSSVSQAAPIVMTSPAQKSQINNLKAFYENSGKLENNLQQSNENGKMTRIIKNVDSNKVGNNLKLANFLVPKNDFKIESTNEQSSIPYKNFVLKPVFVTNTSSSPTTHPKLDVCSKIVRVKDISKQKDVPIAKHNNRKILPKMIPKEDRSKSPKTTSVKLIKLGETYHCLNELNEEQMKIVNHALKIFNNPKNSPKEPTYDPATNTQYIYKVLSPKDILANNKEKEVTKPKKPDVKKEMKRQEKIESEMEEEPAVALETKFTRSGRKVRLPKNILPEETLQKPKRKSCTTVTCKHCSSQFTSLYRLRRHYEHHPTHVPAPNHSNLFHCLLAIIKTGTQDEQANIFLQQLEQFIAKIRSLIPCFIKSDGYVGKLYTIGEDIANLFGISAGKYNLNIDALSCNKDEDGHCHHNPPPSCSNSIEPWSLDSSKETTNIISQTDDCAGNNSADNRPGVNKRMEFPKESETCSSKKIKLSDSEMPIERCELNDVDIEAFFSNTHKTENTTNGKITIEETDLSDQLKQANINKDPTKPHLQFHSTHFDIRSSPIKPTSTVFTKFLINPEKLPKFEMQEIQPLLTQDNFTEQTNSTNLDSELFIQNVNSSKNWSHKYMDIESSINYVKADSIINDSTDYLKSNVLIEPALLHMKDDSKVEINKTIHENLSNQESVLSLLSYPEVTIKNNVVDFPLDLFSFSN